MPELKDRMKDLSQTPSPSIRSPRTVRWVMAQVLIALIPPTVAAVYFFGWSVLIMLAISISTAVLSEYLYEKILDKPITIGDLSAVVTGTLMGLSLPSTAPWWSVVLGSAFAIIIVKQLAGGIGMNYFNPAVTSRVMLKVFFSPWITNWVLPAPDLISTSTPLQFLGNGAKTVAEAVPSHLDLFLGRNLGGNIGETCKLAILIGMIYLIVRRVIHPKIPLLFMLATVITTGFYSGFNFDFMMSHLLSGTLIFAAVFMATDYSSGALTPEGKTVFALGGGFLTAVLRIAFDLPGGVGIAIIIMNALAPLIDQKLMPRIYGHRKRPQVKFDRQR